MRVAHLSYSDGGGGAFKAAYRIHRGLNELGVDSTMLVSKSRTADPKVCDSGSAAGRLWCTASTYLDVLPWRLLRVPRKDFWSLSWVGTGVPGRVRALAPDVVQLHWICAGFLRIGQLPRLPGPIVWRLADMWPFAGAEHYVGDDIRFREGYRADNRPAGERSADLSRWTWERKRRAYATMPNLTIVAPSRWLARCARESVLFRERRIEVIPTGQDVNAYRPIPKPLARQILRIPPEATFVMTASMGIGDRRKGVIHLIQALELLRERGYRLLLLGDRPTADSKLPIECHWLGRLNDDISLALAYSAADVFVAPSTEENLANTVIEAMACGVPCVAFDIGGMPDIVRPGRNGYLARPFAVEDLARGIVTLLESEDTYTRVSHEARLTVEREFSADLQARRYLKLYEELLSARSVAVASV